MAEVALFIRNLSVKVINSVSFSLPLASYHLISRIQHGEYSRQSSALNLTQN